MDGIISACNILWYIFYKDVFTKEAGNQDTSNWEKKRERVTYSRNFYVSCHIRNRYCAAHIRYGRMELHATINKICRIWNRYCGRSDLWGFCSLHERQLAGIPDQDKTKLVTEGIYAYSRNPAFLGFDLQYIGILLMYCNVLLAVFTVFAVVMLHLQILQEEKYMTNIFGDEYVCYRKHVLRYLGRK